MSSRLSSSDECGIDTSEFVLAVITRYGMTSGADIRLALADEYARVAIGSDACSRALLWGAPGAAVLLNATAANTRGGVVTPSPGLLTDVFTAAAEVVRCNTRSEPARNSVVAGSTPVIGRSSEVTNPPPSLRTSWPNGEAVDSSCDAPVCDANVRCIID